MGTHSQHLLIHSNNNNNPGSANVRQCAEKYTELLCWESSLLCIMVSDALNGTNKKTKANYVAALIPIYTKRSMR